MTRVYVSIGSNIERERHIRAGVRALRQRYGELRLSPVYESTAVGFEGDNFYNLVAAFDTGDSVAEVDAFLRQVEDANRRDRNSPRFSPRTLDLDLLLYGELVRRHDKPLLPRPEITENAFVLKPLADLAGDLRDPLSGRRYASLWAGFEQGGQALWPVDFEFD